MFSKISNSAKLLFRSNKRFSTANTEPSMMEKLQLLKQEHIPITATGRQVYDLALILNGGFNPVSSFMNEKEYNSVVQSFRMPDGQLFSLPIYFDIDAETKAEVEKTGKPLLISDEWGNKIAFLHAKEIYKLNKQEEAQHVYGGDKDHCEIVNINQNIKEFAVAGEIQLINNVVFPEFTNGYTKGPEEVKELFKQKGWEKIVAFQTRNPMHYAHIELTKRAQEQLGANLYLNPVIGPTKPGDIDASTRMKCYHAIIGDYAQDKVLLNTLPLAMRMGGPREAMMHAIIRKNYGCTHFIVGRDHAGPGSNSKGEDIYDAFAARDFVVENQKELGINAVAFDEMVYVEEEKKYFPKPELNGRKGMKLSGTEVRRRLGTGEEIPAWFSNPKVVQILRENAFQKKIAAMSAQAEQETPVQLIKKALEEYGDEIAISFSGAEDVLLIEYAKQTGLPFRVFSLDTGRLHAETYEYFEKVEKHYGIKIEYTFPDTEQTKELVNKKGMFSFFEDGHKECCTVRKVAPLKDKLSTLKAWITGIRKDQSETRTAIDMVSVDPSFKGANEGPLIKFNPLTNCSSKFVWTEINNNQVPFNQLHLNGFVSIGCQPCTRPTNPGQHERQGRWWWEDVSQKECGLHAAKSK